MRKICRGLSFRVEHVGKGGQAGKPIGMLAC
jgi:hypothetical protein